MKILKENGKTEEVLKQIEDILNDNGIIISTCSGGLMISSENKMHFRLQNIESGEQLQSLPRTFDADRMVLIED